MPKEFSLRRKMILGSFAAVFIPLLIMGTIVYNRLSKSLMEIYRERSVQIARNAAGLINLSLKQEIGFITAISEDNAVIETVYKQDYLIAVNKIKSVYKKIYVDYLAILIADKYGIVRADSENGRVIVDVSDRFYFREAKDGRTGMQGPFLTRNIPKHAFLIARPLIRKNEFTGAVIMAISLDYLIEMISPIRSGKTGYAFVTNREGIVIIHPVKEYVLKVNMRNEPGMEDIVKKAAKGETGTEAYTFRGTKKIAGFTPVDITGWTVVFTQNREEIMKPVNAILFSIFAGTCMFLFIVISAIVIFSKRLSSPVQKVIYMLEQLISHSDNIILSIGLDKKITFANPAAEKIFGKNAEEITGTEPDLTNLNNIQQEEIWKELSKGKVWSGNIAVAGKTDESITLSVQIAPVIDDSGAIQSYLEIARDITDELKLQSRLIQSEKMEALGAMAGGIAHDFNNVLSGILGYAELSLLTPGNPTDTQNYLKEIIKASERVRELVRQIMTFSRQTSLELRSLSPKPVIHEAVKLLRASVPSEIELRTAIESDSMIIAESIQLHQILVNICVNAVHSISGKTGVIGIDLKDITVDSEFAGKHPGLKPGKHVVLRITDSGKGIDPGIIDRIFEPFFTTKPQGEGTGLGLSVVHGIVKKLNGIITVYSKVGEGTAFNIIIPAIDKDKAEKHSEITAITGGSERILLVDDEKIVIEPLKVILENLGYKVTAFTESIHALEEFRRNPEEFDIIITDYSMPHMTGIEMIENMKKIRSDLPVIINSGYITEEINELFAKAGIFKILSKPINTFQLADAIREAFA